MYDPDYISPIKGGDTGGRDTTAFLVEGKLICATCMRTISGYYDNPITYVQNPYYMNMVTVSGYNLCSSCCYRFGMANDDLEKFIEDFNNLYSLTLIPTLPLPDKNSSARALLKGLKCQYSKELIDSLIEVMENETD